MGLGAKGPPIPIPINFSVVPYPVKRKRPSVPNNGAVFEFVHVPEPTVEPDEVEDNPLEKFVIFKYLYIPVFSFCVL